MKTVYRIRLSNTQFSCMPQTLPGVAELSEKQK